MFISVVGLTAAGLLLYFILPTKNSDSLSEDKDPCQTVDGIRNDSCSWNIIDPDGNIDEFPIGSVPEDIVVFDSNLVVIENNSRSSLVEIDENELVFNNINQQLDSLEENDFIVSEPTPVAPFGFLRKILLVEKTDNGFIIFKTEEARLPDVISNYFREIPTESNLFSSNPQDTEPIRESFPPFNLSYPFDQNINKYNIRASGNVGVEINVDKLTWQKTEDVSFQITSRGFLDVRADITERVSSLVRRDELLKSSEKPKAIVRFLRGVKKWGNKLKKVLLPVCFGPDVKFFIGIEGTADEGSALSFSKSFSYGTTLKYPGSTSNGWDVKDTSKVQTASQSLDEESSKLKEGNWQLYLKTRLASLSVFGEVARISLFTDLYGKYENSDTSKCKFKLGANLGGEGSLFGSAISKSESLLPLFPEIILYECPDNLIPEREAAGIDISRDIPGLASKLRLSDIVYFDFDKSIIRDDAKPYLDSLANYMIEKSSLILSLSTHADCRGSILYNDSLSERRALEIKQYLLAKNINSERINISYLGERSPINNCSCPDCTENEHQENRRASFSYQEK